MPNFVPMPGGLATIWSPWESFSGVVVAFERSPGATRIVNSNSFAERPAISVIELDRVTVLCQKQCAGSDLFAQ